MLIKLLQLAFVRRKLKITEFSNTKLIEIEDLARLLFLLIEGLELICLLFVFITRLTPVIIPIPKANNRLVNDEN